MFRLIAISALTGKNPRQQDKRIKKRSRLCPNSAVDGQNGFEIFEIL